MERGIFVVFLFLIGSINYNADAGDLTKPYSPPKPEPYEGPVHEIKIGHIFEKYHKLGVELIGNGVRYYGIYYGLKCDYTKMYQALHDCYYQYWGLWYCLSILSNNGLIGAPHKYEKYGRGFGLGCKFQQKEVEYHHHYYKYQKRRTEVIQYMTVCYHTYHKVQVCVNQLIKQHVLTVEKESKSESHRYAKQITQQK